MKTIKVEQLINDNKFLKQINDVSLKDKEIEVTDILRPGVELQGFFDYYSYKRIQLYGMQEVAFLNKNKIEKNILEQLLVEEIPMIVLARNLTISDSFIELATKKNIPIFTTSHVTSKVFAILYGYLEDKLAPETRVHGVMMNIHGIGVLIQGESGVGKSEVALELIKKGHSLIADDSVILRRVDTETLISSAPKILQNKMEIRGIGIVDIQKLYGVTSVLLECKLDFIVELSQNDENIERIGNKEIKKTILEVPKKKVILPVLKGKNMANLIEVAVAEYQLRQDYGYNASEEFVNDLENLLKEKNKNENN